MDDQFISTAEAKTRFHVSDKTLRRWDQENQVDSVRTPGGWRKYSLRSLNKLFGISDNSSIEKQKICYCRVSSNKQVNDLERQKDFMRERFPNHIIISDVGSGINWKRKNLVKIIHDAIDNKLEEIVIAHRDRLCRFSFDLLETIFRKCGVKVVVFDEKEHMSAENELAKDLLSIIHVFNCRQMGRRRYKTHTSEENTNVSDEESEENNDELDGSGESNIQ